MDTATITDRIRELLQQPERPPITRAGDPVLRRRAADVPEDLDRGLLGELLAMMREVMIAAPGVGLAAPQIGLGLRLAVLEDAAEVPAEIGSVRDRRPLPYTVIINPRYRQVGHDMATWYEGCLSVPGYQAATERAVTIELVCRDEDFAPVCERFTGWQARIVQHETDHTEGTLYLDRAIIRSLTTDDQYLRHWSGPDLDPARAGLGY
ncbi:peptide deformylase [Microlunatus soli]|uniref:Peptide deformylase n=1 Tax=Microlunatus soli TaxID=630515 RepID=A0A1H1YJF0_9ACTN|nr:peptide deformylase [Microlunatus soli]SDT21445.1 peptide deformylase [Microlunatus soli]